MTLVPLYDLTQQFNNKNGAILVGGRLYVYYVGRTELATTWADEDAAAQNTNPVLLDNNGRAPVFVDDSYSYTLVVCDRAGTELFSQDITPGGGDAGSVGGRIVYHDETLSGAGTVSSLLGVVNIPLGVDETMTAYTGVAEGKDALILGVNGDWFNETFSGEFDRKVDWEDFSACCINVKGRLGNKLDASAINNYYTKNEVDGRTSSFVNYNFLSGNYYNKFETSSREELYSAFLSAGQGGGGGGGDSTPCITGAKIIDHYVQTLTDNTIVQVLSSFTLSGNKNHCIAVKGGLYRFPNKWEIASGIAETNYYMPQSSMSGYLPISSFSSYTTSIQNNLDNNWNYTGSAYNLSISNFHNKLDISAFSSWSANLDLSGDYLPTSASGNFYPMTGNPSGFLTEHQDLSYISGKIDDKLDTTALENLSGEFYPMTGNPSGFLTEHQSLEDYYKKTETSSKEEISAALKDKLDNDFSGNFYPMTGNPSGFLTEHQDISNLATKDELLDTSSFLSASISSISSFVSGNDDKYYPLTGNPSGFLTEHQDLSDYATTSVVNNISSYLSGEIDNKLDKSESANYYPMTGNPSGFLTEHQSFTDYYKKTETSSKEEISAAIAAIPGGDAEVNNVVHNNSGSWNNITGLNGIKNYDLVKLMKYSPTGDTLLGQISPVDSADNLTFLLHDNLSGVARYGAVEMTITGVPTFDDMTAYQPVSSMTAYYPMTGNPSGFLTAHQSLTGYYLKTETSSRKEISAAINELSGKLPDIESVYTLTGGTGVEIETDHVNQKTIINVTGQFDNTAVNNVVQNYSANGTWLTAHQSLSNYYTKTDTSSKQEIDTALQYISSNAGKTYTGDEPIYVNNETNHIGITGESLSAGPNIDIFASGGYVVISANGSGQGSNCFPMTGTDGTTNYFANANFSSFTLTAGQGPAGAHVKQTVHGVLYEAYPTTDVSASWYNIINATNNRSNCYCIRFTNDMTAASLEDYSAYDKVTVVHSNEYTPDCRLYWVGKTKVFPSGLYCELVKGTNDQNQTDWFFTTSGWINNVDWV